VQRILVFFVKYESKPNMKFPIVSKLILIFFAPLIEGIYKDKVPSFPFFDFNLQFIRRHFIF